VEASPYCSIIVLCENLWDKATRLRSSLKQKGETVIKHTFATYLRRIFNPVSHLVLAKAGPILSKVGPVLAKVAFRHLGFNNQKSEKMTLLYFSQAKSKMLETSS
jgi:hypothetical protein